MESAAGNLVQYPLPTLSGGITQQPHTTRFLNQFEDADNADFTVFDGLRKRCGSYLVTRIDNSVTPIAASAACQIHKISRDSDEQYLVVASLNGANMRIRVFDQDGVEATVTFGAGANTYLTSTSAAGTDLRFLTIADGTLIANSKVATSMSANTTYSVDRTYKNADVMISNTPTANTYHHALLDGELLKAGFYQYTPGGSGTFPTYECTPSPWSDWVDVNGGDWNSTSDPKAFRMFFQRHALSLTNCTVTASGSNWNINKTNIGAGWTALAGDHIYIQVGTGVTYAGGVTAGAVRLVSITDANNIVVTSATGTNYAAGLSATLIACVDLSVTGVGREYENSINFEPEYTAGNIADMDDIAARIQEEFRRVGADGVTVAWIPTTGNAGKFRVGSLWRGQAATAGFNTIIPPWPPITGAAGAGDMTVSGRPFSRTAADYSITAGTGSTTVAEVRTEDRWTEVGVSADPNYRPVGTTMPFLMTRTVVGPPATFVISEQVWDYRPTGDNDTNKAPKLLQNGGTIQDMLYHQNRLWLFGAQYALGSEADNLFNFYKTDDTNIVESDRIENTIGSVEVPAIQRAMALRSNIAVTTENGRLFELSANGGPWTPGSVGITPGPQYKTLNVKPTTMDDRLYFPFKRLGKSTDRAGGGVAEYAYDDMRAQNAAEEVTGHVPLLFEDTLRRMESIPTEGCVALLTDEARRVYVWRTYFGANGSRQQSAWSKYTVAEGDRICDIGLMPNGLYMFVESGGQYWWQRTLFEQDYSAAFLASPADFAYPPRMDRCQHPTGAGTFGGVNTTWTISYADASLTGIVFNDGLSVNCTSSGTTVTAVGDWSAYTAAHTWIGQRYTMVARLSRQFLRTAGGGAITRDKLLLNRMTMHYRRLGSVDILQERDFGGTLTHSITNTTISGQGEKQVFQIGWSDRTGVEIRSSDPKPAVIPQIEFEADAAQRPI